MRTRRVRLNDVPEVKIMKRRAPTPPSTLVTTYYLRDQVPYALDNQASFWGGGGGGGGEGVWERPEKKTFFVLHMHNKKKKPGYFSKK
jgi:hypothetical protein